MYWGPERNQQSRDKNPGSWFTLLKIGLRFCRGADPSSGGQVPGSTHSCLPETVGKSQWVDFPHLWDSSCSMALGLTNGDLAFPRVGVQTWVPPPLPAWGLRGRSERGSCPGLLLPLVTSLSWEGHLGLKQLFPSHPHETLALWWQEWELSHFCLHDQNVAWDSKLLTWQIVIEWRWSWLLVLWRNPGGMRCGPICDMWNAIFHTNSFTETVWYGLFSFYRCTFTSQKYFTLSLHYLTRFSWVLWSWYCALLPTLQMKKARPRRVKWWVKGYS